MADDTKGTYTHDEHIAILSDRVTRETATLTAERDDLSATVEELESKLDVTESAKVAAETRATEAEKALEDFKTEVTEREEAASRKDGRLAKVREVAAHLGDDFFADEKRVARIVAMSEDAFEGYVADLGATGRPAGSTSTVVPRETAMAGDAGGANERPAGRSFLLRGYVAPDAAKGA